MVVFGYLHACLLNVVKVIIKTQRVCYLSVLLTVDYRHFFQYFTIFVQYKAI